MMLATAAAFILASLPVDHPQKPAATPPPLVWLDAGDLARERASSDPRLVSVRTSVADLLEGPIHTVVEKTRLPPSGDKHDYLSLAPYWWPDPAKPNGLPYIRRDGERNPEIDRATDKEYMARMVTGTTSLARAYYLTGDERYAARAAAWLRAWFLAPATRMNPNLSFAQGIPGVTDGRGTGIIDTHVLIALVDVTALLGESPAWTPDDRQGLAAWFSKLLDWLLSSPLGKEEAAAKNNHGSWYDAQVAAFARLAGRPDVGRQHVAARTRARIDAQIEPDGRQPEELARTRGLGYSAFNLRALATVARLAEGSGVDLWRYEGPGGRSIRKAIDWLLPYALGEARWPYEQIVTWDSRDFAAVLDLAAAAYGDARYAEARQRLRAR